MPTLSRPAPLPDLGVGGVRSIERGGRHHVTFGRGRWVLLYVLYSGRESNRLERRVEDLVREIEQRFADVLETWDGDMDRVRGLRDFLAMTWDVPAQEVPLRPA